MAATNTYSSQWFKLFLETQSFTSNELEFLQMRLPNPPYKHLLDLGCGQGRHANPLAATGYDVVGIDVNEEALSAARAIAPQNATFINQDMRTLSELKGRFDAVLSLWQSFGYFDAPINREVLEQISDVLEPKGRLVLDIFNRTFYERNQGVVETERAGSQVRITNEVANGRLTSTVQYENGEREVFNWQLFSPEEVEQLAWECGLKFLNTHTWFSEDAPITEETPRLQYVFERRQ